MLQLKDLEVYTVIRVIFHLAEEIPCISALVIALLAEVHLFKVLKVSGCYFICFWLLFYMFLCNYLLAEVHLLKVLKVSGCYFICFFVVMCSRAGV